MITFLPLPSYKETARVLDDKRLGSQRREAYGILMSHIEGGKLSKHTVGKMWTGYEQALILYTLEICQEWISRGFNDGIERKILPLLDKEKYEEPWWRGHEHFHKSHRSNLLRKDPKHYGRFGWTELPFLPYVWPGGKGDRRFYP